MRTGGGEIRRARQSEYDVSGIGDLRLAAKKKSLHDSQRDTARVQQQRADFKTDFIQTLEAQVKRLKFLDETGLNLGLTRVYGRAAPGQRVVEGTPGTSGAHYTVIAALGWSDVQAPWIWEGSMTSSIFEEYVEYQLGPSLRRGDIVVVDNLSAHKCARARQLIEARGAQLVFLPPYSSDFNPIEWCWAKVKTALRTAKARTWDALVDALAKALRSVNPADVQAWFAHCGYAIS